MGAQVEHRDRWSTGARVQIRRFCCLWSPAPKRDAPKGQFGNVWSPGVREGTATSPVVGVSGSTKTESGSRSSAILLLPVDETNQQTLLKKEKIDFQHFKCTRGK